MPYSQAPHHKQTVVLWTLSFLISLLFITAIAFIWHKAYFDIIIKQDPIIEASSFNTASIARPIKNIAQDPTFIPTGIYIHQLSMGADKITFAGYIWQKYPNTLQKTFIPGVVFPQASTYHSQQLYTFSEDHHTVVGWSVRGTLQQRFDFRDYPFDSQKIAIEILPNPSNKNTILIPDFKSYPHTNPKQTPGLNGNLYVQNWSIEKSYFNYQQEKPITNFGYYQQGANQQQAPLTLPRLVFNVVVNHALYSSVITNTLPIIILLVLLFIILMVAHYCSFHFVLASNIFLFFISLIAYISFKNGFKSDQLVFLDYVYFTVQGLILIITSLAVAYYKKIPIAWVHYHHMLIPQLIYWPLITAIICLISALFFL